MKYKIPILILALVILKGCSQVKTEAPPETTAPSQIETISQIEEPTKITQKEIAASTTKADTTTSQILEYSFVSSTEVKTTKPVAETITIRETTTLVDTTAPTTQIEATTQKIDTTTAKPFDINYYVNFAKSYAASLGFRLDPTATACWDNPIAAGPNCIYTERDIKNYLNMYSRMDDVTDIWIWSEQVNENEFLIYIGYA